MTTYRYMIKYSGAGQAFREGKVYRQAQEFSTREVFLEQLSKWNEQQAKLAGGPFWIYWAGEPTLIKVQVHIPKGRRLYTYYAPEETRVGDEVVCPVRNAEIHGTVVVIGSDYEGDIGTCRRVD